MKVQEIEIDKKLVTQVFVGNDEIEEENYRKEIEKLKMEKGNVVVFSSGNGNIGECFKYMLQFMKNKAQVNSWGNLIRK